MASTLADLGRWLASLRDRTVLNEAECARLMSEQVRGEGETAGMGYGWLHSTSPRGARLVSRDAVHGGFSALIRLYPDDAASIIVLSNRVVNGRAPCEAVANRIDALMHGGEVAEIPAVIEIDEELLKPVAGLYVLMPSWLVMVETDGQSLVLAGDSQDPMNAIFSPTVADDERAFASRTCKDAQWIMQQASRANFKPLIEHVSPSIEWAAAKTSLEQWFADPRRASGDFKFARAQGTIVAGNGCGRTVLRVVFNQGQDLSFLYEFIWRDRKIVAMSGTEKMPRRRFLHTGDGHFSSFDVLSGRTTGFQIVHPPPDGASTRIRLVFDSGAIVYRSRDQ